MKIKGLKVPDLKTMSIGQFTVEAESYDYNYKMVSVDYPDILAELESEAFKDVLDCGCGTGAILGLLHEKHPDKCFTGIDLTPKMIEVANGRGLESVRFVVGDCENLPFEEESFDTVICSHSFHHYPTPINFFNSVKRVLRPGGRLILRDNTGSLWFLLYNNLVVIPRWRRKSNLGDVKFYSLREVRKLCKRAGLTIGKLEERPGHKLHCVARKPDNINDSLQPKSIDPVES